MEWSRVKSILICMFAVVNVFLLFTYVKGTSPGNFISDTTVDNTVEILRNNGVTIDKNIIPVNTDTVRMFDFENKYASAADVLPQAALIDSDSFEYILPEKAHEGLSEKEAEMYAEIELKNLGLLPEFKYITDVHTKEQGGYTVTLYPSYEKKKVVDVKLVFEILDNGMAVITGHNWLQDRITNSGVIGATPVTEVLIKFAVDGDRQQCEITDIDIAYYIGSRAGKNIKITALPVWALHTADGETFYYDVRNAEEIK